MITKLTRTLITSGIIFSCAPLICPQASAQTQLYQKKTEELQNLHRADEKLINRLTSIRYALMSGHKKNAVLEISSLLSKLTDNTERRIYDKVDLILLPVEDGHHHVYLYFPASYEEINEKEPKTDQGTNSTLDLFKDKKRVAITASLDINYLTVRTSLGRAMVAASKDNLKEADEYLQKLYASMLSSATLAHDPIKTAKSQLNDVEKLLKQGKVGDAISLLNDSEQILIAHIKETPDAPYANKLQNIMQGYDKIRTYNHGKPEEAGNIRNKIFGTVSDMKSKLKYISIDLDL